MNLVSIKEKNLWLMLMKEEDAAKRGQRMDFLGDAIITVASLTRRRTRGRAVVV